MSKAKKLQAKTTTRQTKPAAKKADATVRRLAPKAKMAAAGADDNAGEAKTRRKAAPKSAASRPTPSRRATDKPAAARRVASAKAPAPKKPSPAVAPREPEEKEVRRPRARTTAPRAAKSPERRARPRAAVVSAEAPTIDDQQRIEAHKYGVVAQQPRQFEEERFLFPRNYEINRIRLVVRDPQWLFAYWDVNPRVFDAIRSELGERVMALSRLTLKMADPESSASEVILLPYGARSWYVRVEGARRSAVAELGITLPSGQFRSLARSNAVHLPRSGPSTKPAVRSMSYEQAWLQPGLLATGVYGEDEMELPPLETGHPDPGTSRSAARGASDRFLAERQPGSVSGADTVGLGASDIFRR